MDELFHLLSSSARIDKSKRRKKLQQSVETEQHTSLHDDNQHSKSKTTKKHSLLKQKQIHSEMIAAFRNKMSIQLSPQNRHDESIPDPISSFEEISSPLWLSLSNSNNNKNGKTKKGNNEFSMLKSTIIRNIESGFWINPTAIQMQVIPSLISRRDVMGCAPTGSGKSGAFIIPSLFLTSFSDAEFYHVSSSNGKTPQKSASTKKLTNEIEEQSDEKSNTVRSSSRSRIRAIFLAPSRELAGQLHREVLRLGDGKFHGLKSVLLSKSNVASTISSSTSSKHGIDVLVSTPLRLMDFLENSEDNVDQQLLDLSAVRIICLDEADRLLDTSEISGSNNVPTFLKQIDTILSHIPETAVRGLFSATISTHIRQLAESILRNPVDVSIGSSNGSSSKHIATSNSAAFGVNENITQSLKFVGKEEGKLLAIRQIIAEGVKPPLIIFLQSKDRAQALYQELLHDGIKVDVLHADKTQKQRDDTVSKFRMGTTWTLICTDLCARGLDFKAVNMVINYDLPTTGVNYVHRIGRCGRAGRKGVAITLFTEADFDSIRSIANVMKLSGCTDIPDWMLSLKKKKPQRYSRSSSKKKEVPKRRKTIDTGYEKKLKRRKKDDNE